MNALLGLPSILLLVLYGLALAKYAFLYVHRLREFELVPVGATDPDAVVTAILEGLADARQLFDPTCGSGTTSSCAEKPGHCRQGRHSRLRALRSHVPRALLD